MAAPANQYTGKSMKLGTTDVNAVKALIAIPTVANAALKTRFYLDATAGSGLGAAGGALTDQGFNGMCIVGSANYYMHNLNRIHPYRDTLNGQVSVYLNDGGLNTLGKLDSLNNMLRHANYATFSALYRSSWWNNTTKYGIRHRKVGVTAWTEDVHGSLIQMQQTLSVARYLIRWGYAKGESVQFEGYITNEEGTFYFPAQTVVMLSPIEEYITQLRSVACTSTTNTVRIWLTNDDNDALDQIGQDVPIGGQPIVNFYTDPERTIKAPVGFYAYLRANKSFYVDSNGRVNYWVNCPVQPVFIYVNLRAFVNFENGDITQLEISTAETHSFAITVTGRVQNSTNHGKEFSLTIPIGQKTASNNSFNLQRNPVGSTYYFEAVAATPTGQNINVQYNSTI